MSVDFELTELDDFSDVQLTDATQYQDQTGPAPLQPGNWELRVDELALRKDQDGELIKDEGYPIVQINKATVVGPEEFAGREIYPFKSYSLRPYQYGTRKGAIPAVDLLRAFDDTLTFASGKEVLELLAEQAENGRTIRVGSNWIAKDSDYIKEALDAAGGFDGLDEDERKELFKKAIFRGQKKFPKVNGSYIPEVTGPSGDVLEARVDITRLYPSSKEVRKMGPFKRAVKTE